MKNPCAGLVCFVLSAAGLAAQTVEFVLVEKATFTVQTDQGAVGPSVGSPYGFAVEIDGVDLIGLAQTPTVTAPGGGPLPLAYDGEGWLLEDLRGSKLALDGAYQNGNYTVAVDGVSLSFDLSGDAYPNTPIMTLSGGLWSGGRYVIAHDQELTITTNAFTAYGTNVDDHIGIDIAGFNTSAYAEQLASEAPGSNTLSLVLPAYSLTAGFLYSLETEFNAIVDLVEDETNLPGSFNVAVYSAITTIELEVIPEPGSAALLAGGLALVAAWLPRRRRPAGKR